MAEFIMKDMVEKAGLSDNFVIDSRATSREEEGNGIHYGARRVMDKYDIPYTRRFATVITKAEYDYYDIIMAVDESNYRRLKSTFYPDKDNKIVKMFENRDVADPWWTGDFETTYRDVTEGCKNLLDRILQ